MSRTAFLAAGAGVASALLYLSILAGSPGAVILAYLSSLPLFVAGLSLGVAPLLIAAATGTVVTGVGDEILSAAMYAGLTAGPVVWIVHLALLSRQGSGTVDWYPAGRLVTWLSVLAGGYFLVAVAAEGEEALLAHEGLDGCGLRGVGLDRDAAALADLLDEFGGFGVQAAGVEGEDAEGGAGFSGGAGGHVDQGDVFSAAEGDAEAGEAVQRFGEDVFGVRSGEACGCGGDVEIGGALRHVNHLSPGRRRRGCGACGRAGQMLLFRYRLPAKCAGRAAGRR